MRLYGKRFLRRSMDRSGDRRIESRDGILWDVILDDRVCRVKVQGSNELIVAWFPENWGRVPEFLKPGNAVRIAHVGGVRGRIEVVGHGLRIPTPVSGGTFPTIPAGLDCVLTGMGVVPVYARVGWDRLAPTMMVRVEPGTYRIAGDIYTFPGSTVVMGEPPVLEMGTLVVMGEVSQIVAIDAPPAVGSYRYDLISIDAAGVIHYTKGTAVEYNWMLPNNLPQKPVVPGGHVGLSYIFLHGGMTGIEAPDIGRLFEKPAPARLIVEPGSRYLYYVYETSINVFVKDQYGNNFIAYEGGIPTISLEIIAGHGLLRASPGEPASNKVSKTVSGSMTSFRYEWVQGVDYAFPVFLATLNVLGHPIGTGYLYIGYPDGYFDSPWHTPPDP